jgi:hypothetical protein
VKIITYCQFFHFPSSFRNKNHHHQLRINDFYLQMVAESKIDISNKKIHDETSNDESCGHRTYEKRVKKQHFLGRWHGKCKKLSYGCCVGYLQSMFWPLIFTWSYYLCYIMMYNGKDPVWIRTITKNSHLERPLCDRYV